MPWNANIRWKILLFRLSNQARSRLSERMFLRAHFLYRSCNYALRSNLWTLTLLFIMMNVSLGRNGFIVEIAIHFTDYLTITIKVPVSLIFFYFWRKVGYNFWRKVGYKFKKKQLNFLRLSMGFDRKKIKIWVLTE